MKKRDYTSLMLATISFAAALVLAALLIFVSFDIIALFITVLSALSGCYYLYRGFSYEAAVADEGNLMDERSAELQYKSKAAAFDFMGKFATVAQAAFLGVYFDLRILEDVKVEPLAYIFFGVWLTTLLCSIVQTVVLNRMDKYGVGGGAHPAVGKRKLHVKRIDQCVIGFGGFILALGYCIYETIKYRNITITMLALCIAILCLIRGITSLSFGGK